MRNFHSQVESCLRHLILKSWAFSTQNEQNTRYISQNCFHNNLDRCHWFFLDRRGHFPVCPAPVDLFDWFWLAAGVFVVMMVVLALVSVLVFLLLALRLGTSGQRMGRRGGVGREHNG